MKLLLAIMLLFSFAGEAFVPLRRSEWKKYPYHAKGALVYFPLDEGSHPHIPGLEWWYTVIHAQGKTSGDQYSILVTHFNNSYRFFTVTNITKHTHTSGTTKGALVSQMGQLDLMQETEFGTDTWRNKRDLFGRNIPFEYEMETFHSQMHLKANLVATKNPMMIGGTGLVQIGMSGQSWYYSQTRLAVEGELTHEGLTEKIEGIAWMDHQWGPFVISPVEFGKTFETYEWFCVQLDTGHDMMISNVYDRFNQLPQEVGYGGIQIIDAAGVSKSALKRDFTRTSYWQDPESGHYMSMGWELKVPDWDLQLKLTPDFKEQMVLFPMSGSFWEGSLSVVGTFGGKKVTGKGFGELIHRFQIPQVNFNGMKPSYDLHKESTVAWTVANPDAGNPLNFSLEIVLDNGELRPVAHALTNRSHSFRLADFISEEEAARGWKFVLHAYSVDKVLHGFKESEKVGLP